MATNYIENTTHKDVSSLTWKTLVHADPDMQETFQLLLSDTAAPLHCNKVIRIIPGKRLVTFGKWNGQEVVAKLFYEHRKAKRHLKQDAEGVHSLMQANIPTPRLLYQGNVSNDKRIQVLLFERIMQAKDLETIWKEQSSSEEFSSLMHNIMTELATQHVLGILQNDPHLKNFLVTEKQIYTLDGGGIKKYSAVLSKKKSINHLSLFFSQLGVGTEGLQHALFETYAKSRAWIIKQKDIDLLSKSVARKNKIRDKRYQHKIFRTCTAFVKTQKWNKSSVYDRTYQSSAFLNLLNDPEKIMAQPDTVFLKTGRSATVAKVTINGRFFVIKRYNIKNGWHRLRRCLRSTRAAMSWQLAQRLSLFGISTAKPIAYIEHRFLGLRMKSYFIMEYVAGKNIGEFFSDYQNDEERCTKMADKIKMLFNQLSELKITHGDLKLTNLLVKNDTPVLIDLDGMRQHTFMWSFKKSFNAEIKRFMKNWSSYPKIAAFFKNL